VGDHDPQLGRQLQRGGEPGDLEVADDGSEPAPGKKVAGVQAIEKLPGKREERAQGGIQGVEDQTDPEPDIFFAFDPPQAEEKRPQEIIAEQCTEEGIPHDLGCGPRGFPRGLSPCQVPRGAIGERKALGRALEFLGIEVNIATAVGRMDNLDDVGTVPVRTKAQGDLFEA
jgi:hypothetical protein